MKFEFATTQHIVFGPGMIDHVGEFAAALGKRAWFVVGSRSLERLGIADRVEHLLKESGVSSMRCQIYGEPDVVVIDHGARLATEAGSDLIVALGGGSAIDAAKAMASLLANGGETLDYMEVVGKGKPITKPSIPFIAIPTTAGTGSEATRNAVITHRKSETKASLRSRYLLPTVALLDPTLTHGVPAAITASTGLDA